MKGMKLMAAMCALVVMSASVGGLPLRRGGLFDTIIAEDTAPLGMGIISLSTNAANTDTPLESIDYVADVNGVSYADFDEALNAWTAGTTLTLLADVELTDSINVFYNKKTIDLNGKTLRQTTPDKQVLCVSADGDLVILDSSGTNAGTLTGTYSTTHAWIGSLYINQGSVVDMYGGTICGNTNYSCGGVWLDGRRVYTSGRPTATFNMYGGVIRGNSSLTNGGGITAGLFLDYYVGEGKFNMYGGTITGNTAAGEGNNIYIDYGMLTMTGGTIDGGFKDKNDGYAIITFDANGGTGKMSDQYVKKGTNVTVKKNENYDLDGNKNIGFTRNGYIFSGWNTQADGSGTNYIAGESSINISADTMLYAQWTEITATVTDGNVTTNFGSFSDALSAWTDGTTLTLLKDTETSGTINVTDTKTLDLNGYGIRMTGDGSVISVDNGGELTVCDSDITRHHAVTLSNYRGTAVADGMGTSSVSNGTGTAYITGGYITGGYADSGGAITLTGGSATMNGGNIIGNVANYGGGGVFNGGAGTFELTQGIICYNSSNSFGGGIMHVGARGASAGGLVKISGGFVTNNSVTSKGGGGIFSQATIELSGSPDISGNKMGGSDNNLAIYSSTGDPSSYANSIIKVTDALTPKNPIGVMRLATGQEGAWDQACAGVITASASTDYNDAVCFTSDDPRFIVGKTPANQLLLGEPCTVTYQANGHGTAPTAVTAASGSVITEPTAPTASGWTFDGWYYGDTKFDFSTPITEDTTLTARWLKSPAYTVTIPADVSFSTENCTATAEVIAQYDVGENTLSVTVASVNDYKLKADYNNTVLIPYTLTCEGTVMSSTNNTVLTATKTGETSKTLQFGIDPDQMYAGAYKDTLTFNISLT